MEVTSLAIPEVLLLAPRRHGDARGYFVETYQRARAAAAGIAADFVQDNLSYSAAAGTVRALHCQRPPHAQAKLVGVVRGRILDVAVDARRGSPTFARHVTAELSAENGRQLFVPAGFLHGFVTLEPDTVVTYKVDAVYDGPSEAGVRWNDPDLAIAWGVEPGAAILSDKDAAAPAFADFETPFVYEGAGA